MASSSSPIPPPNDPSLFSFLPPEIKLALYRAYMKLAVSHLNASLEGAYESSHSFTQHEPPPTPPPPSHFININSNYCQPPSTSITVCHAHTAFNSQYEPPLNSFPSPFQLTRRRDVQMESHLANSPLLYHAIEDELRKTQSFAQNEDRRELNISGNSSLGKTFLGLTFQATVAIMVFHYYQSLSSPDYSPSPSSSSSSDLETADSTLQHLHFVEVAIVVGSAASLIGILLHNAYPAIATIVEKIGAVFAALGFFAMMGMFLDGIFEWIGWLAGICSVLAFIFASKR